MKLCNSLQQDQLDNVRVGPDVMSTEDGQKQTRSFIYGDSH